MSKWEKTFGESLLLHMQCLHAFIQNMLWQSFEHTEQLFLQCLISAQKPEKGWKGEFLGNWWLKTVELHSEVGQKDCPFLTSTFKVQQSFQKAWVPQFRHAGMLVSAQPPRLRQEAAGHLCVISTCLQCRMLQQNSEARTTGYSNQG